MKKLSKLLFFTVLLVFFIPNVKSFANEYIPVLQVSATYPIILNSSLGPPSYMLNVSVHWLYPQDLTLNDSHKGHDAYWAEWDLVLGGYRYKQGVSQMWRNEIQRVNFTVIITKTNDYNESNPLYYSCIVEDKLTAKFLFYDETALYAENETVRSSGFLEFTLPDYPCGGVVCPFCDLVMLGVSGIILLVAFLVVYIKKRKRRGELGEIKDLR